MPTPQTLVPPRDLPFQFYKLIKYTQHCIGCKTNHEHSELYGAYQIRTGYGYARLYKPSDIQFRLKMVVENKNTDITLFCHDCWQPGALNHLPLPPQPAPKPVAAPTPAAAPKQQPKAPKNKIATADDLDF